MKCGAITARKAQRLHSVSQVNSAVLWSTCPYFHTAQFFVSEQSKALCDNKQYASSDNDARSWWKVIKPINKESHD
jgi:hypothetical protein